MERYGALQSVTECYGASWSTDYTPNTAAPSEQRSDNNSTEKDRAEDRREGGGGGGLSVYVSGHERRDSGVKTSPRSTDPWARPPSSPMQMYAPLSPSCRCPYVWRVDGPWQEQLAGHSISQTAGRATATSLTYYTRRHDTVLYVIGVSTLEACIYLCVHAC